MDEKKYNQVVLESMHELRYFNQRLKNLSEQITAKLNINKIGENQPINMSAKTADQTRGLAESILNVSQLFSTRLDFIDYELNPDMLEHLSINDVNVYGKFDKARKMLNSMARGKKVKINMESDVVQGRQRLMSAYSIIDILPYLLLDNAVKYSPNEQEVEVKLIHSNSKIEISIDSLGPIINEDDIKRIADKHYRGDNAQKKEDVTGRGLGLYFVNMICELHNISITYSSDEAFMSFNGIPYSNFAIKLVVPL